MASVTPPSTTPSTLGPAPGQDTPGCTTAGQKRPTPPPEPQLTRTGRQQRRKVTDEYVIYGRLLVRNIEMWTLPATIVHEYLCRYASDTEHPASSFTAE